MNELQAVLNLISSALLGDLASFLSPRLVIAKDDTASTDGRTWIRLPEEFLGIRLGEREDAGLYRLARARSRALAATAQGDHGGGEKDGTSSRHREYHPRCPS